MLKLGNATVETIVDLDPFDLPINFLMPSADIARIEQFRDVLEPDHVDFAKGIVRLGVQSHLLRIGGLNVLIDSCVGEHKQRPRRADWHDRAGTGFLERLAAAGIRPEDVDVVLCTHLHADHIGWNTRLENGRWVPTFPKARYLVSTTELTHWQAVEAQEPGKHNHGVFADSMLPIVEAGLSETVDDGFELAAGARLTAMPGHTPGQIGLCLDCGGGRRAIFCSDVMQTPVQVYHPEWSSAFCSDKEAAAVTRRSILKAAVENDDLVIPAHLRNARAMRIEKVAEQYRPIFVA